ncbi:organic hydroperoxide resistance protein [Propionibacterium australiense]|uniref:Ohr family peroxiredoxin n=1 Tax=Propionibacterium australiense TaxID=119981 RepID=A0A383S8B1_9ACTN|nr:organic hydroperoxide resistance protein [Propionibacterium australiense]RLP08528.1 Ohr family peroxiredoxin [Propionibacterium australiense]RLP08597.1 Ohr family peroxiredoxin [Propionibacterium australiense]SYZ33619.1 Organic hydroperoxide resistance protein famiy [Propionibacterium australiense]VEH88812.1 General stress protein 17o [Propionibacterium australiense]
MTPLYTTEALSTGAGRNGHVRTTDGSVDLDMAAPKELGGNGAGANPEQLFASGYAACFHSALLGVARSRKIDVTDSSVGARVSIGKQGDGYGLEVTLEVILPGVEHRLATELAEAAHQVCPYSNATRGNIPVTVVVSDD